MVKRLCADSEELGLRRLKSWKFCFWVFVGLLRFRLFVLLRVGGGWYLPLRLRGCCSGSEAGLKDSRSDSESSLSSRYDWMRWLRREGRACCEDSLPDSVSESYV